MQRLIETIDCIVVCNATITINNQCIRILGYNRNIPISVFGIYYSQAPLQRQCLSSKYKTLNWISVEMNSNLS